MTRASLSLFFAFVLVVGCSTIRTPSVTRYKFPKEAYLDEPDRPYETLGLVKTRIDYPSLNAEWDEQKLCENYYNQAVQDLIRRAKDVGGDAVIGARAVTFMIDGKTETHLTAECSDDGQEGQVLAQGIAVKWKRSLAQASNSTKSEPETALPAPKVKKSKKRRIRPEDEVPPHVYRREAVRPDDPTISSTNP